MKKYYLNYPESSRKFVDREEIRSIVMEEIEHKIQKEDYFKVISIYGFGGMGKTCLINELKEQIQKERIKCQIYSISFEIQNNNQYLENLIAICKVYQKPCILFYYGLMCYWDRTGISQLDTSFMKKISNSFLTDFIDTVYESSGSFFSPIADELPSIPSISNILGCIGTILDTVKKIPYHKEMERIKNSDTNTLLENLPILLALDINSNEYKERKNEHIIFIFDSYQQSIPYSESVEWLLKLIGTIHKGLFIVTSREKLLWEDAENDIMPYQLEGYPEVEARRYLESSIPTAETEILDMIIVNTQCVPIYVELAIDVYQKEYYLHPNELVNKSYFSDRHALVIHFINHLKSEWHQVIINLAIVRIFNYDIFCYIVKLQNLQCPYEDFYEIVTVSLMHYIENSRELIKIHDVFCKNVVQLLNPQIKYNVLYKYLEYIIARESIKQAGNQLGTLITFYINIIHIEIDLSMQNELPINIVEKTLDLFFLLWDIKAAFSMIEANNYFSDSINDILFFVHAVILKNKSTQTALVLLRKIKKPQNFGYHIFSYELFNKYTLSLTGDYYSLKSLLRQYQSLLNEDASTRWYYMQVKLYTADYLTMEGKFLDANDILIQLEQQIDGSIYNVNNYFYIKRYKGHIFRFNFYMEKACQEYNEVLEHLMCSSSIKAYIYTNFIESRCYFDPNYVLNKFPEALSLVTEEKQVKNEGKLYYSRAISYIIMGRFEEAENDIKRSIFLNHKDGYQSGELFAYMAQSYLDFSYTGHILDHTLNKIEHLLNKNKVYEFFRLPIAIMTCNNQSFNICKNNFSWIDFDYTVQCYINFFNSIRRR